MVNPVIAACDGGFVPDRIAIVTNPSVTATVDRAAAIMTAACVAYDDTEPTIDRHPLEAETDFAAIAVMCVAVMAASACRPMCPSPPNGCRSTHKTPKIRNFNTIVPQWLRTSLRQDSQSMFMLNMVNWRRKSTKPRRKLMCQPS
jgi:hypothetical protein